ncbi:MAG: F0F1 ATP synthase subunit delta [Pseudomonadota bacterium]|nr:F0F1 ATP synthase subunit delta [Pseudomonadota bacterium]
MSSEPIGGAGLAGRYAAALFDLADAGKELDSVSNDLLSLDEMIDGSDDLKRLLQSPVISRDDQGRAIGAIGESAELGQLTRNFVGLVAQNRRLFALQGMIRAYHAILSARRGEVTAEVTSATPLSESHLAQLNEVLRQSVGAKVAIQSHVDPGLLGGLIVKIGSRMIDSSLKTKLQKLQFALKGVA